MWRWQLQVVILSHSGLTAELLPLPPLLQAAGCSVLTVTGSADSALAQQSDVVRAPHWAMRYHAVDTDWLTREHPPDGCGSSAGPSAVSGALAQHHRAGTCGVVLWLVDAVVVSSSLRRADAM